MKFDVAFYAPEQGRKGWHPGAMATPRRLTLERLIEVLTTFRAAPEKLRAPGWGPHRLSEPRRAKRNVINVSCLVYDYDDGTSLDTAAETWAPWLHVLHTSWSHTEPHPKFRVVLPLEAAIPAEHFLATWLWGAERAGRVVDAQCKDPARLYFLPCSPTGEGLSRVHDGPLLDPRPWRELPPPPRPPRKTTGRVGPRSVRTEVRAVLRTPEGRHRAAAVLGARVLDRPTGTVASRIPCPRCGRDSVFFVIDAYRSPMARCEHRGESCGWHGWIDELIEGAA